MYNLSCFFFVSLLISFFFYNTLFSFKQKWDIFLRFKELSLTVLLHYLEFFSLLYSESNASFDWRKSKQINKPKPTSVLCVTSKLVLGVAGVFLHDVTQSYTSHHRRLFYTTLYVSLSNYQRIKFFIYVQLL